MLLKFIDELQRGTPGRLEIQGDMIDAGLTLTEEEILQRMAPPAENPSGLQWGIGVHVQIKHCSVAERNKPSRSGHLTPVRHHFSHAQCIAMPNPSVDVLRQPLEGLTGTPDGHDRDTRRCWLGTRSISWGKARLGWAGVERLSC